MTEEIDVCRRRQCLGREIARYELMRRTHAHQAPFGNVQASIAQGFDGGHRVADEQHRSAARAHLAQQQFAQDLSDAICHTILFNTHDGLFSI